DPAPAARAVPEMPKVDAPPRPEPAKPATVVSAPPRTEAKPAPRPAAPAPVKQAAPAAAPRPAPAPASTAEPKAGEEGGGWLRDVLRNASAQQAVESSTPAPAAAPQRSDQQNLTSLTDDIARSMDDGALSEAWRRYQAGEQAVFSR